jgi:hypothetical protein
MTTHRPHWDVADAIEAGELSAEQRKRLAALVRGIGILADEAAHHYRSTDPSWRAVAWDCTVEDYDRLMGRTEGGA